MKLGILKRNMKKLFVKLWWFVVFFFGILLINYTIMYFKVSSEFDREQKRAGREELENHRDSFQSSSLRIMEEQMKINFVFIKTMKTGTETIATILRRFAYKHDLNFALPQNKNLYFGWPFLMEMQDIRLSSRPLVGLIEHAIYNRTFMSAIIPPKSLYITIIREPWKHFLSTFNYFQVEKLSTITAEHPITEYLHNINKYEAIYKSPQKASRRYCIPDGFSITKNLMAHCLGFPLGFPPGRENITSDIISIRKYIDNIDKEFALVMIMEYFTESLVLLKRLFHWDLKDMLYFKTNIGNYTYRDNNKENHMIHKKWSSVDYILYDHYNRTFWKKVNDQGSEFSDECKHFDEVQSEVSQFCGKNYSSNDHISFSKSRFSKKFDVTRSDCRLMRAPLLDLMKNRFVEKEGLSVNISSIEEELPPPGQRRGC